MRHICQPGEAGVPSKVTLGVMTICHRRHLFLHGIADCLLALRVTIHWQIHLNRPTSDVLEIIRSIQAKSGPHGRYRRLNIEIFDAPFAPLDGKERFMELRQVQLERLPPTDWGVIWDDDHFLLRAEEAHKCLIEDWDLVYATKLFFWNDDAHYTTHLPPHRSVFFFRRLAGDRFPTDRTIHAPARIHDSARRITELTGPLLDFGYMDQDDRERCFLDYKRAGKIDPATLALVREPELHEWPGPYRLREVAARRHDKRGHHGQPVELSKHD